MKVVAKRFLGALAAVGMCAAIGLPVVLFLPIGQFVPRIENAASERLGVPVRVAGISLNVFPRPHLAIASVSLGKDELQAEGIRAFPRLSSLFSETRVVDRVEIERLQVKDRIFAALRISAGPKGSPKAFDVRELVLNDLRPLVQGAVLGRWKADLKLGGPLGVQSAELRAHDSDLVARLTPQGKEWNIAVTATQWQLPAGPPLRFRSLSAKGTLDERWLRLPFIRAEFYGGVLTAAAETRFAGWQVLGRFEGKGIDVAPLARALAARRAVSGKLEMDGVFASRAPSPQRLGETLAVAGRFSVVNGVLYGVDFAGAASSPLTGTQSGGETRFDEFVGGYQIFGTQLRLRNLVISSGALAVRGGLDLSGKDLSGRLKVEMKSTGGLLGMPMALSGTVDDPKLGPTRGTAMGAAFGTLLLPGIGTTLGAKLGSLFDAEPN
jgi:uncharacterized protein involved in outer membrane biogenesis